MHIFNFEHYFIQKPVYLEIIDSITIKLHPLPLAEQGD